MSTDTKKGVQRAKYYKIEIWVVKSKATIIIFKSYY